MIRFIFLLPIIAASGCASRLSNYPGHFDASTRGVHVGERKFVVQHHEDEQMLMVTPTILAAMKGGFMSGATLYAVDAHDISGARDSIIAQAGLAYLENETCRITNVESFGSTSYELTYECEDM